ncbi:winged helix-turn-helix domain-containing protein [Geodermatophilus sp. YIM 151500]|uniref:BTAD domain-containing putative transcriptional regulator n=1 Tax=Geodermatophilus sp. YIM 151500 TaxID=2984531 RepID=UPI0021E403A0|nr:BTAD domain-containing putative transcriptional regulator [Geodermatophilus sp. YIM 151500]MCV2487758.1 winged helix-turn-helix domain-containing protein [Geodermatophilus sp. YIM 151500]
MLFRVLGPLEVEVAAERIPLPGSRSRALLVALLLQPGTAVPVSRLVDALWPDQPPDDPVNALHQVVRRLRARLGPLGHLVRTRSPGYELAVEPSAVDAERFEAGCREARRLVPADPAGAVARLDEALALWRGPAFGEFAEAFARGRAVRMEELRTAAQEDRAALLLESGAVGEAIGAARELVAREPLRSRPVEVLMRALEADRRPAEALEAFRRHRAALADELGMDPSASLRELQTRILRGDGGSASSRPPPRPGTTPAPTPPTAARALPWRPGELLGRAEDRALLRSCLAEQRLVTVVGPGGVGKTRLVLEVAHELAADGRRVWWVDLSAVTGQRLADAVAEAAGTERPHGPDPAAGLAAALAGHRGVLVLDNAETVLEPLAPLVERLLAAAPELTLVATSRERLAAAGEHVHVLAPLPLPAGPDRDNPAVRLFVARAPGLEVDRLSDEDLDLVVATCRRLDGLPLAIEIGAARAPALGLREFADRLGSGLDLLTGGRRTAAARHRSVRAVVDWSFGLLGDAEARLLVRLGVFPGSFPLDRVEAVCADDGLPLPSVGPLLARLVEQSLVQAGEGRFWLLETLRTYTRERLDPAERHALRARHACDVARRLAGLTPLLTGPDEPAAVAAIAALGPDLHAAWSFAAEHDQPLAVRLAADVMPYAYLRQRLDLLDWGLAVAGWEVEHPRLPDALAAAAAASWAVGDVTRAGELARRGVAAAGGFDAPAAARAVNQVACEAMFRHRAEAVDLFRRSATLHRAAGEEVDGLLEDISAYQALTYVGGAADAAAALPALVERARATGNPTASSWACFVLGEAEAQRDPGRALAAYESAVRHGTPADNRLFVMLARTSAVALTAREGTDAAAVRQFAQVLDAWEDLGNEFSQWWVLLHLAVLLARLGAERDAALLAGAVLANLERLPELGREMAALDEACAALRRGLGPAATDAGLAAGAGMPVAAAVAHARAAIHRASGPAPGGRAGG